MKNNPYHAYLLVYDGTVRFYITNTTPMKNFTLAKTIRVWIFFPIFIIFSILIAMAVPLLMLWTGLIDMSFKSAFQSAKDFFE